MIKDLNAFLHEDFEGLVLEPPLFYSWTISIRFEIAPPMIPYYEKEYLQQTFDRAIALFKKVFDDNDEMLLVADVKTTCRDLFLQRRPLNVYLKYIKDKESRYKLQYHRFDDPDEEEMTTHRFVLPCAKNEIRYVQLLKAICYEDFAHPSTILKNNPQSGYQVYFINVTQKLIYHLYDDRGCDVIAAEKETIRFLYEDCNEWILDYDRDRIERLFN
ncbi:DUF3885 domain-containing protein [Neobacillus sp. FSL H8-0543]|uniref:DUF3885 domain-containing protein n=1 Tax=Neobacillus sp. FSL H8-0543 TaxID=2954672 RepID=UPI003158F9DD